MEKVKEVLLPDIGDFPEVDIIEILVAPGDRVEAEDSLLTLESDKATMEIPAPFAGQVKEVTVKVGDRVSAGSLLALITVSEEAAAPPPASEQTGAELPHTAAEEVEQVQAPAPTATQPPSEVHAASQAKRLPGEKERHAPPVLARPSDRPAGKPHASPAVRRFARELGVDLTQVPGSGPKDRITKDDVQNFIKRALSEGAAAPSAAGPFQLPAMPEVDFAKFGEVEVRALSRIKKID